MAEYNDDSIDIHTNQSAGEDEEDEEQSSQESPYHNPLDQSVGAANHLKHQRVATGGAHSGRQSPRTESDDRTILREIRRLGSSVQQIADRVGRLESRPASGPTPKKPRVSESRCLWADIMDETERGSENLSDGEVNPDIQDTPEALVLSDSSTAFVTSAFNSTLSNGERRRVRSAFPTPEVTVTRCPKLDAIFKTSSVKQDVKTADAELVRLQAFVHDPVAPLLQLVHAMDDESVFTLDLDGAKKAAADAVRLLGNASAQISKLRRKKVLKAVNPDIQDLAEEDIFQTAAPQLFGRDFEAKMKDRAKSIKLLAAAKPHHTPGKKKFFQSGRPTAPPRGGGRFHRGGRQSWTKKDKPAQK